MQSRDLRLVAPELLVMPHARTASWPIYVDGPRLAVYSVAEALARRYTTDAHTAAYAATPHARRLSTGALAQGVHPRMVLVVVDVDHDETHRLNNERAKKGLAPVAVPEAWRVDTDQRIARLRAEAPGIVAYHTRGGARLVGLLAAPHTITDEASSLAWKVHYARTLARLSRLYGVVGDPACDDWTRLYRLPRATRKGSQVPEAWPVVGELADVGVWPAPRDEELADDIAELRRLAEATPAVWRTRLERVARATRGPDGGGGGPGGRPMVARSRTCATPTVVADFALIGAAARAIGEAYVAAVVRGTSDGNAVRLAIIGALLSRGWSPVAVERTVAGAAAIAGDPADRWTSNVAVVSRRFAEGGPMRAEGYLWEHARPVAEALAQATDDSAALEWRRRLDRTPQPAKLHTPDEAAALTDEMLWHARRPGCRDLLVIAADAGAGKTHATCDHAAREALEQGRRTAMLAPSHTVARECVDRLRARGVKVAHLSGVLAHVDDEGTPTCRHHNQAQDLAEAGCDVRRVLCDGELYGNPKGAKPKRKLQVVADQAHDPCSHREACEAYKAHGAQAEELANADVVVAVHQLAHVAHAWLRVQPDGALAVVDEAPELLAASRLTADELRRAAAAIGAQRSAVVRSEAWRAPMLLALAEGLSRATDDARGRVSDLLVAGLAVTELAVADDERVEQVRRWAYRCARRDTIAGEATGKVRDRLAPRPAKRVVTGLRAWRREAEALAAVRVAGLVAAALAHEHGQAPRVAVAVGTREHGELKGVRELRLTGIVDHLAGLLADQSIGRVILDATTDPRILEQVVALADDASARTDGDRTTVAVERLAVRDAAPVARVFVSWAHGSRRYCLPDGADGDIAWAELAGPMREGLALAAEGLVAGDRLAVFSWRPVAEALERAVIDPAKAPPELAEALAGLRRRGVVLLAGHYGATRGRNDWRDAKGLLAVGTPWPDGATVAQTCNAVGLGDAARDVGAHLARAELEQVVGRLRAPRRSTPARLVVVASAPPLRADARYQVRELARGRPVAHDAAELAELAAAVGRNEAARITGASQGTVSAAIARRAEELAARPDAAEARQATSHDGVVNNPEHTPSVLPLSDHPIVTAVAFPPRSTRRGDGEAPPEAVASCGGCSRASPRASTG